MRKRCNRMSVRFVIIISNSATTEILSSLKNLAGSDFSKFIFMHAYQQIRMKIGDKIPNRLMILVNNTGQASCPKVRTK